MDEPSATPPPGDGQQADESASETAALQERIEQIRADARRARAQQAERDDMVAFVRELGFDDLLED